MYKGFQPFQIRDRTEHHQKTGGNDGKKDGKTTEIHFYFVSLPKIDKIDRKSQHDKITNYEKEPDEMDGSGPAVRLPRPCIGTEQTL